MQKHLMEFISAVRTGDWGALPPHEITARDYSILMQYIPRPEQRVEATRRLAGRIVDLKTNMRLLLDSNPFATEKAELRQIFREQEQQIPNVSIACSFSRQSLINSCNTSKASLRYSSSFSGVE